MSSQLLKVVTVAVVVQALIGCASKKKKVVYESVSVLGQAKAAAGQSVGQLRKPRAKDRLSKPKAAASARRAATSNVSPGANPDRRPDQSESSPETIGLAKRGTEQEPKQAPKKRVISESNLVPNLSGHIKEQNPRLAFTEPRSTQAGTTPAEFVSTLGFSKPLEKPGVEPTVKTHAAGFDGETDTQGEPDKRITKRSLGFSAKEHIGRPAMERNADESTIRPRSGLPWKYYKVKSWIQRSPGDRSSRINSPSRSYDKVLGLLGNRMKAGSPDTKQNPVASPNDSSPRTFSRASTWLRKKGRE